MRFDFSTGAGRGLIGRLMASAFGLFFACIGLFFVQQGWQGLQKAGTMQAWSKTTGTIVTSDIADDGEDFRLNLSYHYTVGGKAYTGERFGNNVNCTAETIGEIRQAQNRWAAGRSTDVYYNPADPAEAVLVLPTLGAAYSTIGFALIFPAFGLLFATLPWLGGRRKDSRTTHDAQPKSHRRMLVLFGLVFVAAGLAMVNPLMIQPLRLTLDTRSWISTPATVVSSKVKSHSDDDGTTYSIYIAYRYEVGEMEYYGDRYTIMGGSSSGYDAKAEIVRQNPEGREISVYVNPNDPAESIIHREPSLSLLFCLFPLPFIIVGSVVLIQGFRRRETHLDMAQAREHIVELKASTPKKKVIGLTLFTTLWLGIVYGLSRSDAPLLFPIVFGCFGLLLLSLTVHAILSLFNPTPRVELTPGSMHPGTRVAMRWRTAGRTDRIRSLSISLSCIQVTTETRRSGGRSETSTVRTPLHEEQILSTENQAEIAQGTLQFTIPAELPSSRPGDYNGIQWKLTFRGDIPHWPDMESELFFIVYPTDTETALTD